MAIVSHHTGKGRKGAPADSIHWHFGPKTPNTPPPSWVFNDTEGQLGGYCQTLWLVAVFGWPLYRFHDHLWRVIRTPS